MTLTQDDLRAIQGVVKDELQPIKKGLSKIQKDITIIINTFDNEILELKRRVSRLEIKGGIHS
jgi:DNA anti-recombination protein RmuC